MSNNSGFLARRIIGLLTPLLAIGLLGYSPASAQTERPVMVWANSFWGANNSGIGLGIKTRVIGIGASVFGFAGDSASSLPPRPGGRGYTIDAYIFIDTSPWLAINGSIGYGGWIDTYDGQDTIVSQYEQSGGLTAGAGLTFTLLSRFAIGVGYAGLFTPAKNEGDPKYDPIHRVVMQLGYRY
jgi:hypothetical protein